MKGDFIMKKRNLIKKIMCGLLIATILFTNVGLVNAVADDDVHIEASSGIILTEDSITVDVNDPEGNLFIRNSDGTVDEALYNRVKDSLEVTTDIEDLIIRTNIKSFESSDGMHYVLRIIWGFKETTVGTKGTMTVKFDDFEETYTVKVVDYKNTISEVLLDGFESQYDEEGNILFEMDLSSEGTFQDLYFRNLKGQRLEVGDGSYDASKISIDGFVNAQEDISWSSDKDDLAVDTVVGLTLGESLTKEGMLSVTIFPTRTGEAYFNVNYGDFTQRVHVVVGNRNNLPEDIQLDKYELTVSTGEKVTINAYNCPENAYYDGGEWLVSRVDGDVFTDNTCRMSRNDNIAELTFYEAGVYTVQNRKSYDSDRYLWGVKMFYSSVCTITVIGDTLQAPEGGIYSDRMDDSITPSPRPTDTPVPTESTAPTETPVPTETEKPTDVPTGKYLFGDVDFNGKVTSKDALAVLKHSACLESLDGISLKLADISEDGNIDAKDALIILKIAATLEDEKFIEIK